MSGESLLGLFTAYGYGIVFGAILLENAGHVGSVHERLRAILVAGLGGLGAAWLIIALTRSLRSRRA